MEPSRIVRRKRGCCNLYLRVYVEARQIGIGKPCLVKEDQIPNKANLIEMDRPGPGQRCLKDLGS